MANVSSNVWRVLLHLGIAGYVVITKVDEDRVWGWADHRLLDYMVSHEWDPDERASALHIHGTKYGFREPGGVRPALQVLLHPSGARYFVEMDLDYASPSGGFTSFLTHATEVIYNFVTRKKTNQDKIAALLNKRGVA